MFHPSLLLLFLDGHFEATPDYALTDLDVHDFLPNFPDLKTQVKRTPPEDELFGYLAKSVRNTPAKPTSNGSGESTIYSLIVSRDPICEVCTRRKLPGRHAKEILTIGDTE